MKISEKNLKRFLFILKYIHINYEVDTKNEETLQIVKAISNKNRLERMKYIIDTGCNIIDDYYKDCPLCKFKNNKCECHRKKNLNYINGCCRYCKYQSNKGCTTKNVACKLFNCTYVDYNGKKKLEFKDINLFKCLSLRQRYILNNMYFTTIDDVAKDLYYGPVYSMIRFLIRFTRDATRIIKLKYFSKNDKINDR